VSEHSDQEAYDDQQKRFHYTPTTFAQTLPLLCELVQSTQS
jgi:hypothetical protein